MEPRPKAALSGSVSELDAKGVFHFWNEVLVGVPKTFAFFSSFISTAAFVYTDYFSQTQRRKALSAFTFL
ncbi:hypothetical protein EDM54_06695 [Brevibacillus borstelensis]|nr:hypothetical protein EDM54_06695 [Brevibacillus borstelensis]